MVSCRTQQGILRVHEPGLLFSTSVLFDSKNDLIYIDKRSWGFFRATSIHRFKEIERIVVTGETRSDSDGGMDYIYIIELVAVAVNRIWRCEILNDDEQYKKVLYSIQDVLQLTFEEKSLANGSVRCKQCDRVISKVSGFCIYCGQKKRIKKK